MKRRYDYFVHETGDWATAEEAVGSIAEEIESEKEDPDSRGLREDRDRRVARVRLMGTPEQGRRADGRCSPEAGINGCAFGCFDYQRDIEMFGDLVAPLAELEGLRDPSRRPA